MAEHESPGYLPCFLRVYEIVREIPVGKVMTYGQIATLVREVCRSPVPAVTVGRAMAASGQYAPDIPWWRVIGRVGHYGVLRKQRLSHEQQQLLAREGILSDADGRYDLSQYLYTPEGE
ncbi:MAG TPA: MGMT family protein [Armatimonadota bacterium]|jgi:methylated-DNA-protein-cysteine methyltransferase-like protein